MQINDSVRNPSKKWLFQLLKALVTLGALVYLVFALIDVDWSLFSNIWTPEIFLVMVSVLALMPLNWSLEAWKWRISVPHEQLSVANSWLIVCRGLAWNWLLPLTMGDAMSRVGVTKPKKKSVQALMINRGIGLLYTLIFGLFGVGVYLDWHLASSTNMVIAMFALLLTLGLTWYSNRQIGKIGWIALLRHLLFTFQLFWLISVFNPQLSDFILLAGIGWIFLIRTAIPALLGGLGVREASAMVFFQPYMDDPILILIPCLLIWLINQIIPAFWGVFLVWRTRNNLAL